MYLYYIRFSYFVKERFQVILCAAEIWRSPEAGHVRAKGKLLPLTKILRALRIWVSVVLPMESPAKRVFIGSDEQRNERAFGKPAGSETIWSLQGAGAAQCFGARANLPFRAIAENPSRAADRITSLTESC